MVGFKLYRLDVFVNLDGRGKALSDKPLDENDEWPIPRGTKDEGRGSPDLDAGEMAIARVPVLNPVPAKRRIENELAEVQAGFRRDRHSCVSMAAFGLSSWPQPEKEFSLPFFPRSFRVAEGADFASPAGDGFPLAGRAAPLLRPRRSPQPRRSRQKRPPARRLDSEACAQRAGLP